MIKLGSIETISFRLFIVFFLFSNLFTRIIGIDINAITYIFLVSTSLLSIRYVKENTVSKALFFCLLIFFIYHLDPRFSVKSNIYSAKDFVIPLLAFPIGAYIAKYPKKTLSFVNIIYLPFILYGVLQAVFYYTGLFDVLLPWDNMHIYYQIQSGVQNMYQGHLLRFFGTMNAFVEYQVTAVFIGLILLLNKDILNNKSLVIFNTIILVLFLGLSLERSPILMFLITIMIWKIRLFDLKRIVVIGLVILCLISVHPRIDNYLINNSTTQYGWIRFRNIITMSISEDAAVSERKEVQWEYSLEVAEKNIFGIGAPNLSPSARTADKYQISYIGAHNNFLAYYLAFGFVGLLAFFIFVLIVFLRLYQLEVDCGRFGFGTLLSFIGMAIFNAPFTGKCGTVFFLIVGFLVNQKIIRDSLIKYLF